MFTCSFRVRKSLFHFYTEVIFQVTDVCLCFSDKRIYKDLLDAQIDGE